MIRFVGKLIWIFVILKKNKNFSLFILFLDILLTRPYSSIIQLKKYFADKKSFVFILNILKSINFYSTRLISID